MISATVTYLVCVHGGALNPFPYDTALSEHAVERQGYLLTEVGASPQDTMRPRRVKHFKAGKLRAEQEEQEEAVWVSVILSHPDRLAGWSLPNQHMAG